MDERHTAPVPQWLEKLNRQKELLEKINKIEKEKYSFFRENNWKELGQSKPIKMKFSTRFDWFGCFEIYRKSPSISIHCSVGNHTVSTEDIEQHFTHRHQGVCHRCLGFKKPKCDCWWFKKAFNGDAAELQKLGDKIQSESSSSLESQSASSQDAYSLATQSQLSVHDMGITQTPGFTGSGMLSDQFYQYDQQQFQLSNQPSSSQEYDYSNGNFGNTDTNQTDDEKVENAPKRQKKD